MPVSESVALKKTFKASIDRVFAAFENAEIMEQWFSPDPMITLKAETYEFYVGGNISFKYTIPNGPTLGLKGEFEEVSKNKKIVFTWEWQEPDEHAGIPTVVRILFKPQGEGTELFVEHINIKGEPMKVRHTQGWEGTFDRLEALLMK